MLPMVCLWVKARTQLVHITGPWNQHTHYPGTPEKPGVFPCMASLLKASQDVSKGAAALCISKAHMGFSLN